MSNRRNYAATPALIETLEERQLMAGQRLFFDNFEAGGAGWSVDTNLGIDQRKAWSIASGFAHSGGRAAGTTQPGIDAVLASPAVNLPAVNQYTDHLYLRWWEFSDYTSRGGLSASTPVARQWEQDLGTWGPWNVIDPNTETTPGQTKNWVYTGLDLTQFSGQRVQVGFHHYGNANGARGWFVDDVEITKEAVQRPWSGDTSFENGFSGWSTTRGMWDVGTASGISSPSGSKVAGTGLNGTPAFAETSSLVSPAFTLPAGHQSISLDFKSYLDHSMGAVITVEFQFWMPSTGWSPVNNVSADLSDTVLSAYSPGNRWTSMHLPLTNSLGGATILPHRLLFSVLGVAPGSRGWFIDDVKLNYAGKPNQPSPNPVPQGQPEIAVFNAFGELTDGVTSVRFGNYAKNSGGKDLLFTIRNVGNGTLNVGAINLDRNSGFAVVKQPATSVAAGGYTTFTLRLLTTATGNKSAAVRFNSNDANESPFNFNIAGMVLA